MQFYEYTDCYTLVKRSAGKTMTMPDIDQFHEEVRQAAEQYGDPFAYRQASMEQEWIKNKRPYYNVWPAIIPMVEKLRLDIPCSNVNTPLPMLSLRMPSYEHNPFKLNDTQCVRTILLGHQKVASEKDSDILCRGLAIAIDFGEVEPSTGLPVFTFKFFPLREDMTIEQAAESLPYHESWKYGQSIPLESITQVVKLCCCVCLIGNDPDLVSPDVLAKDKRKYAEADEQQKIVITERAKRRGKYGFDLGGALEIIPHYRRPHLAVVWTGKGRKIPKVVMRKGAVVHREKLTVVPTGDEES